MTKHFKYQPQKANVNLYNNPNAKQEIGEYNKYFEYFDVVTNCGTTEHVDNQNGHNNYIAWKNLHDLLRVDGLHFSSLPAIGYWPDHCNISETGKIEPNVRAAFIKTKDSKFLTEDEFNSFVRVVRKPFYAMGPNAII